MIAGRLWPLLSVRVTSPNIYLPTIPPQIGTRRLLLVSREVRASERRGLMGLEILVVACHLLWPFLSSTECAIIYCARMKIIKTLPPAA